jgi:hypothetical protein
MTIKKVTVKKEVVKKVRVRGTKEALIDEAVRIKRQTKKNEIRMKEIKKELAYRSTGTYVTSKGGVLCIAEKNGRTSIPVDVAIKELKKKRKGQMFSECVSVVMKKFENILDKDTIESLKKKYSADPTLTWSYK